MQVLIKAYILSICLDYETVYHNIFHSWDRDSHGLNILDGVRDGPDTFPSPKTLGSTWSLEVPPTAAPWGMLRERRILDWRDITVRTYDP